MSATVSPIFRDPAELRAAIRSGSFRTVTVGQAPGYAQANLVIVPGEAAAEFAEFCRLNPRPCPLIARTAPGNPEPVEVAPGADLRTDVPRYRVFRHGSPEPQEPTDIRSLWRDDLVAFLLGCSFTFESALAAAGLPARHVERGTNVPMYRTQVACQPAGRFRGPMVVSMRPYRADQIERVRQVTGQYPRMHGAPIHVGDPAAIGIADIRRPDFGDPVPLEQDELPVFWACGVTPQMALEAARLEQVITHSPGYMFVTDRTEASFRTVGES